MQKIRPFLWYDNQAEEAAKFYASIFRNSKIGKSVPGPEGRVLTIEFELEGTQFVALNGGPHFKFSEAISLTVDCTSQGEVDELWEKLSEGGSQGQCGWLKDKYGLSWQIVPRVLVELLTHPDPATSQRVMQAMMQMSRIDIATLREAAAA
ncbi:VOC family protein [Nordella sp. HKS 07]|uniref:VOC family protein n=1 Tax=Nordella sp. HKS 07 TaxID=2712222 RepID=UPI0013E0EFCC|nr:VOC family protein [Nordella sp. HKS 07]QIG51926.1 VOC family protein [Nordella sp. HKS 07]